MKCYRYLFLLAECLIIKQMFNIEKLVRDIVIEPLFGNLFAINQNIEYPIAAVAAPRVPAVKSGFGFALFVPPFVECYSL